MKLTEQQAGLAHLTDEQQNGRKRQVNSDE